MDAVILERHDDVPIVSLDEGEVMHTIEALQSADKKLRIAVDRWKRLKRPVCKVGGSVHRSSYSSRDAVFEGLCQSK